MYGQLGRRNVQSKTPTEQSQASVSGFSDMTLDVVPELSAVKVVEVACGNNHTLARTGDGRVFAMGLNDYGVN